MFGGLNGPGWAAGALGRDWITYGSLYTVAESRDSGSWLGRWILWGEIEFFAGGGKDCRQSRELWVLEKLLGMLVPFCFIKARRLRKDVFIDRWIGQWKA